MTARSQYRSSPRTRCPADTPAPNPRPGCSPLVSPAPFSGPGCSPLVSSWKPARSRVRPGRWRPLEMSTWGSVVCVGGGGWVLVFKGGMTLGMNPVVGPDWNATRWQATGCHIEACTCVGAHAAPTSGESEPPASRRASTRVTPGCW
eukprot:scaffold11633_cov81-Isochrysis_galbana.AAC.1